ncbi:MAG TPA: hypothetical protein VNR37_02475 [Microbacteriaceae bacterium]|nr:hypothetical protein [Microbacteriaceae bacterium]
MLGTAVWSIVPAWILAIVGAVLIAVTALRTEWTLWVPVVCGLGVIVALALQVATRKPEGFILRASVAVCGVVVVFAVASLVLLLTVGIG